jgi:O-antigen/teichoic acid export membrane protein
MKLLVPAIPLGITLIFNLVYFRADSVVITLTRPTAEVGIYGLAYKVFEVILVFPTFFMNAVYPLMVSETVGKSNGRLKKIFMSSFLFLLATSVVAVLVLWFAAPLLSLIKSDFTPSVGALRVLSLGLPFFFVTSTTMWALIALKKQKALAGIYGVSMIVNIVGNILLVPQYGFMAAAWLTVACEGLVLVLSGLILVQSLSYAKK